MNYANHLGWTDVDPYEVVRVVSEKTIEIREMDTERDESVTMNFVAGGFSAICTNDRDQKWHIKSNAENPVIRIRYGKKGWKNKHGRKFVLANAPHKYYDYNF
jgi:hypothetical protein